MPPTKQIPHTQIATVQQTMKVPVATSNASDTSQLFSPSSTTAPSIAAASQLLADPKVPQQDVDCGQLHSVLHYTRSSLDTEQHGPVFQQSAVRKVSYCSQNQQEICKGGFIKEDVAVAVQPVQVFNTHILPALHDKSKSAPATLDRSVVLVYILVCLLFTTNLLVLCKFCNFHLYPGWYGTMM